MKRFTISLLSSFLAFAAGLFTASSWNSSRRVVAIEPVSAHVFERCPPSAPQPPPGPIKSSLVEAPDQEYVFAQGRLKLVPERVQLQSESMRYDIDVKYPQIVGEDTPQINKINQHLKSLATAKYQWPLKLSKEELRRDQEVLPGTSNSINVEYGVSTATDSFLSIFFVGFSYGIGAAHAGQESHSVNYDLTSGQELKLFDLFKPGSKYLEFIAEHCTDELSRGLRPFTSKRALAPVAKNFENWHITSRGLNFHFDACTVFACAEGAQAVEIPFTDLKPLLRPNIPAKFKIIYP